MKRSTMAHRHLTFAEGDDGGGSGGGGDKEQKPEEFAPITSQDEFNRRIQDRIVRERGKFADYDDLKAKAEAHDNALEDAKTEQQRAVDAAKVEGRAEAIQTANVRLVAAEARAIAAEVRFRSPTLAVKAINLASVKVSNDGTVDTDAIRAELKTLATAEPYLVDDGKPARPKPDGQQGDVDRGKASGVGAGRDMFDARRKPAPST